MTAATLADLRQVPLFAALRDDELGSIIPLFTVRTYAKNAIVLSEGEYLSDVFFVLSGRTRHFWRDEDGQEMDLAVLGVGESFGHTSLINEPAPVSSMTVESFVVAVIPTGTFEALLVRFPPLAVRFMRELVRVIHLNIQRGKVFSMEGVYGRVVWLLRKRAASCDGRLVTERLTHADIARRVGATREMVGHVLRDLARDGYIAASGSRFTILKDLPRR